MKNNIQQMNWEKLSVYFSALAILITFMAFINGIQKEISAVREEIATIKTILKCKKLMPCEGKDE